MGGGAVFDPGETLHLDFYNKNRKLSGVLVLFLIVSYGGESQLHSGLGAHAR